MLCFSLKIYFWWRSVSLWLSTSWFYTSNSSTLLFLLQKLLLFSYSSFLNFIFNLIDSYLILMMFLPYLSSFIIMRISRNQLLGCLWSFWFTSYRWLCSSLRRFWGCISILLKISYDHVSLFKLYLKITLFIK